MAEPTVYWNHNAAYHPWLVSIAAEHSGHVLDVGCGDGLLAQRLAPVSRSVTAIDPDAAAIGRAAVRTDSHRHDMVSERSFHEYHPGAVRFDLITFEASLPSSQTRRGVWTKSGALSTTSCPAPRCGGVCTTAT